MDRENGQTFRFKKNDDDLREWVTLRLPDYEHNFSLLIRQALREKMNREAVGEKERPIIAEATPFGVNEEVLKIMDQSDRNYVGGSEDQPNTDVKSKLAKLGGRF